MASFWHQLDITLLCVMWLHQGGTVRSRLPAAKPLGKGFSIWSLLKNMIGKDLTRLTMPATINEPTSTLQRCVVWYGMNRFG